ncbi:xanthine dehydrogenase YagS FAD-binding subunit [Fibrella aestuarina BUZ 2]|uniref:Xanthine dehydrogenase YagS FAD-binding subunit n=1 Tax=Fibrella aestuarina BUZ 2 TaxID=1166018 RepID=I0KEY3_9BACT|nr:xanthine dehydrogenase family protein subunit M [Fibrella aestuarina]CCH02686.1 xanthine dehydrogenase YagS FAD-binding subunit [Fibrella aestuarina BUZ 2]
MRPFTYSCAKDATNALTQLAGNPTAKFLAGGTNLLDLMKEDVERPTALVDISGLKLTEIKSITMGATSGGVSIGGLGKNTDAANHPLIRQQYPLLTQAILAGASGQIRNMATNGGNLLQRTRCPYFYEVSMPCNKRAPGSGCGALEGVNRLHAIFGWSEKCVAVYPSDMAVALAALDAVVRVRNAQGQERTIAFTDFHRLPGDKPEQDTNLQPGELITAIDLPKNALADHSYYLKVRDRASYAFALLSVAAGLELSGNTIKQARIAMGGVAHKPWRALKAEQFLVGKEATDENFKGAADAEMADAKPLEHNKFKVELGRRSIVLALQTALNGGKA